MILNLIYRNNRQSLILSYFYRFFFLLFFQYFHQTYHGHQPTSSSAPTTASSSQQNMCSRSSTASIELSYISTNNLSVHKTYLHLLRRLRSSKNSTMQTLQSDQLHQQQQQLQKLPIHRTMTMTSLQHRTGGMHNYASCQTLANVIMLILQIFLLTTTMFPVATSALGKISNIIYIHIL